MVDNSIACGPRSLLCLGRSELQNTKVDQCTLAQLESQPYSLKAIQPYIWKGSRPVACLDRLLTKYFLNLTANYAQQHGM